MSGPRAESKVKKSARKRKAPRQQKSEDKKRAEPRDRALCARPKRERAKPIHRIKYNVAFNRIVEDPWRF
jgi:hypothetical protein